MTPGIPTPANRNNNFSLLRFFLASMVLLSHSFELKEEYAGREILTRLFGTLTLGELAVDGFFLVSGFLIVQSWQRNPDLNHFLRNRIVRIFPAFVVASLISAFLAGPLGAGASTYFEQFNLVQFGKGMLSLSAPVVPAVFEGQPYPAVNIPLWTIGYEVRCYLLVALLGACGLAWNRPLWIVLGGSAFMLFVSPDILIPAPVISFLSVLGNPLQLMRFVAFFSVGAAFYFFHDRIAYSRGRALFAALLLMVGLFQLPTTQLSLLLPGAYLLFCFAFAPLPALKPFRSWPDISYGVYLYAWPIQKLLLWYMPSLSPGLLFLLSFSLSCLFGLLSWQLVERPFLRLKRSRTAASPVLPCSSFRPGS